MPDKPDLPIIDVQSFGINFGNKQVINNLSFNVKKGEVFGFLGANGAGKTTTIRTLLGLYEPTSGKLQINGQKYSPDMSHLVGYLPEERGLYRNEPVINTMVYFGMLHGLSKSEAIKRSTDYLNRVGLADKATEMFVRLSGGQQQKIQLGVTILHEPTLMILDEPTEALDPVNRSLLMEIINERRSKGATVMLVTHRMEEVEQLCDRILMLKDGRSVLYGTVNEVRESYGSNVIVLEFSGEFPKNDKYYEISKLMPHYAEITWKKSTTSDEVLKLLAGSKDLSITSFAIRRPTLNDIFLDLYKDQKDRNV